jgi:hypothetical protein
MTELKRYDLVGEYEPCMAELSEGDYVKYDDIRHLLRRPTTEEAEKAEDLANEEIDRIFWVCDSRAEKDAKVKGILNKLIKMITGGE